MLFSSNYTSQLVVGGGKLPKNIFSAALVSCESHCRRRRGQTPPSASRRMATRPQRWETLLFIVAEMCMILKQNSLVWRTFSTSHWSGLCSFVVLSINMTFVLLSIWSKENKLLVSLTNFSNWKGQKMVCHFFLQKGQADWRAAGTWKRIVFVVFTDAKTNWSRRKYSMMPPVYMPNGTHWSSLSIWSGSNSAFRNGSSCLGLAKLSA